LWCQQALAEHICKDNVCSLLCQAHLHECKGRLQGEREDMISEARGTQGEPGEIKPGGVRRNGARGNQGEPGQAISGHFGSFCPSLAPLAPPGWFAMVGRGESFRLSYSLPDWMKTRGSQGEPGSIILGHQAFNTGDALRKKDTYIFF
jgi:hypothetical protein